MFTEFLSFSVAEQFALDSLNTDIGFNIYMTYRLRWITDLHVIQWIFYSPENHCRFPSEANNFVQSLTDPMQVIPTQVKCKAALMKKTV